MQRISDDWTPGTAYIAVFDTSSDEEIETNANQQDGVKGIPLTGVNPLANSLVTGNDNIYVTTRNAYSATDLNLSCIEEINPIDYSVRQVLSAADITDNTASFIQSSVVLSAEQGYFYASKAVFVPSYHEVSSLYQFNPTTGEITKDNIASTGEEAISFIGTDSANFLWLSVSNPEDPGVDIIDTTTNEKHINRLTTEFNPTVIRFIEE